MVIQMRYIQCRDVIDIICAIMSGHMKGAHPLRMRRCYLVVYSKENGGLDVGCFCLSHRFFMS